MNSRLKQSLLAGAAVATIGLGVAGAGIASAANDTTGGQSSLIEKLASKFNLNKDEVAAVFTADRQEHQAQRQAEQTQRVAQAVTDGKLTQAQADHITAAQKEIQTLMGTTDPGQQTSEQRASIRTKMDALRTWATENNVSFEYLGPGGHGGPGGPDGGMPPAGTPSGTSSTSAN